MRVNVHTLVIRIASEEDREVFLEELAALLSNRDECLSFSIDTIPSAVAEVSEMPEDNEEKTEEWLIEAVGPLVGNQT
jgi:hypothetical protein